jgi:hypothetical protein
MSVGVVFVVVVGFWFSPTRKYALYPLLCDRSVFVFRRPETFWIIQVCQELANEEDGDDCLLHSTIRLTRLAAEIHHTGTPQRTRSWINSQRREVEDIVITEQGDDDMKFGDSDAYSASLNISGFLECVWSKWHVLCGSVLRVDVETCVFRWQS